MKKTAIVAMAIMALLAGLIGCGGKKDEGQATAPGGTAGIPEQGMGSMPPMPGSGGEGMPGAMGQMGSRSGAVQKQIVVSDDIKKTWPASKIMVKKNGVADSGKVYEVEAGKSFKIEGSSLRVEVGQYLPDFTMDGQAISSKSIDPNNPTVRLTIFDGDKEIYKGWAFEKYPEAHAFTHPEYSVSLVGAVKK